MKKLIMGLALVASAIACASVDVYEFKSTMNVYSAKKQKYVSTSFNGTMTVDTEDGSIVLSGKKKDSGETFEMELSEGGTASTTIVTTNSVATIETVPTEVIDEVTGATNIVNVVTTNVVDTVVTNTIPGAEGGLIYSIVTGKKDSVAAVHFDKFECDNLTLALAGAGQVKTTKGCGPCGEGSCTKIAKLKGTYIGNYKGGCTPCGDAATHYNYEFLCELPDEKDVETCPVYGSWSATLKTVDGAKFKGK